MPKKDAVLVAELIDSIDLFPREGEEIISPESIHNKLLTLTMSDWELEEKLNSKKMLENIT